MEPQDKILVALSGGADSVALLRILLALGYRCEAAHCNFRLRAEESDRDEGFVRRLCREFRIPLHVTRFDTAEEAGRLHISIEMAARQLRYRWFEDIRQECGASAIAVAHHKDDSAETVLLNVIRGTGINGLCGIRPRNGYVVRPLLCLCRREIVACLQELGQDFVTDSTNLEDDYTRNKIRLNILPLMEEINPSVKESIVQMASRLADVGLWYRHAITEGKMRVMVPQGIRIDALLKEPAPDTLLFEILSPLGFNATQIQDIGHSLGGQPGKCFYAGEWKLVKDREMLLLEKAGDPVPPSLEVMDPVERTPLFTIPRDKSVACLDSDKLRAPLSLRLWRHGDTFVPFGMKGRKKVSDYLTDRKYSLLQKEHQWVLLCGDDIVWLVGERIDNRFRVDDNTRRVTVIRCV